MRIVSLLPSATEIVYALGLEPVATSHECNYPPAAREKPAANRSRVDATASSAEINNQVARAELEGGVYAIDDTVLRAADPDLILTQGVCDVCAVDHGLVNDAVERLDLDATILSTHPHRLADILRDIERVGAATGREQRATELVSEHRDRIEAIDRDAPEIGSRVAVLDWLDPVMVAGHWVPEMIELAGGEYGLEARGARSRPHEWRTIRDYDPEILVAAPCGFSLQQTSANVTDLTSRPGWEDLSAVSQNRVYLMDGHNYVNRPGPRIVDTLEYLTALIHPTRFDHPPSDVVSTGIDAASR